MWRYLGCDHKEKLRDTFRFVGVFSHLSFDQESRLIVIPKAVMDFDSRFFHHWPHHNCLFPTTSK